MHNSPKCYRTRRLATIESPTSFTGAVPGYHNLAGCFVSLRKSFFRKTVLDLWIKTSWQTPQALQELRKLQVITTPVTVVGDTVIIGFDEEKLRKAWESRRELNA